MICAKVNYLQSIKKRDNSKYQYTSQGLVQKTKTFQSKKEFRARSQVLILTKSLGRLQVQILGWIPWNDFQKSRGLVYRELFRATTGLLLVWDRSHHHCLSSPCTPGNCTQAPKAVIWDQRVRSRSCQCRDCCLTHTKQQENKHRNVLKANFNLPDQGRPSEASGRILSSHFHLPSSTQAYQMAEINYTPNPTCKGASKMQLLAFHPLYIGVWNGD